jgi:hypothetical protein
MLKRLVVLAAVLAVVPALAQAQANPRGEAKVMLGGKSVKIDYGRPSLKGRDMLAQAAVGSSWRMGADAATTLTTEIGLAFGDQKVAAGSYTLSAKRAAADKWLLLVAAGDKQVAEVPLTLTSVEPQGFSVETLTIELTEKDGAGHFALTWGGSALKTSFTAK